VIIEGLRRNGIDVVECHEDLWKGTSEKLAGIQDGFSIIKKLLRILQVYLKLIRKYWSIGYYDAIIVGYAGHIDVFLAKFLNIFRRKPLIFDAFLSLYDTAVVDRGIISPASVRAKLLHLIDRWSCRLADAVLLDTSAHIDYFVREFRLPAGKFHAIPVGSSLMMNRLNPIQTEHGNKFNVLYFGSYIPLHGVDVILKAAKILQDKDNETVLFTLVGTGQLLPEMKGLASRLELKNVSFVDRFVGEEELVDYINGADVCLGIFGTTDKALRVIPCKVYNCLAMGKPLITSRSLAAEGILTNAENALLSEPGSPESLADGILTLRNNEMLSQKMASGGRQFFNKNFSIAAIGRKVAKVIEDVAT